MNKLSSISFLKKTIVSLNYEIKTYFPGQFKSDLTLYNSYFAEAGLVEFISLCVSQKLRETNYQADQKYIYQQTQNLMNSVRSTLDYK